nr:putative ribonuclease H-like domain-containing protein [Tanacetum cinerariifolium]
MDVKSVFLYGKIKKEVYVCQLPGFEDLDFPDRVYKVEKEIHGLHQAPRAWYETLSTYLLGNGFQRGKIDKTLFIKKQKVDILLVQVYVDDIIFGSTKKELCNAFERDLQLADEEGVDFLPNSTIFEQLVLMGYEKVSQKLTFYKPFFSPQWKFLIHTVLQCLSPKTTAWNEFSSDVASVIICLATNQKFNFSKWIFDSIIRNLDNVSGKILMYLRRVKKLEKRNRSRPHKLKRLYKLSLTASVESLADEESLGEDASKQGIIKAIDAYEDITLVNDQDDADNEMFYVNDLGGEEDKGKGIMIKDLLKPKKKDRIRLDEETAKRLQAKFDEEERLIDFGHQLAKRLHVQKQEDLSIEEKSTLFQQHLEKRRKHFAAKREEEKRNKPPTQAQKRKIMCNYLKNMEGYKLKDLKLKEFDKIQKMFDRASKRVEDDKETAELKQLMEIIPDEEEVAIDAIPLAVKSSRIVD